MNAQQVNLHKVQLPVQAQLVQNIVLNFTKSCLLSFYPIDVS